MDKKEKQDRLESGIWIIKSQRAFMYEMIRIFTLYWDFEYIILLLLYNDKDQSAKGRNVAQCTGRPGRNWIIVLNTRQCEHVYHESERK